MLSLHLSEWLEWKCRSAAQSVGFLYRVVESLRSAPRLLFFRMVSSNTPIVWGLGAPGGRVLACSFM